MDPAAHLRKTASRAFRFGVFELRPGRQLLREGVAVPLGGIALQLLGTLVMARGNLITKQELFEAVWPGVVVVDNALHQHIRSLRAALGDEADRIVTVPRRGYRFDGDCAETALAEPGPGAQAEAPALPRMLTALIGRDEELRALQALLASERCVTLLGPGGIGKTRLALAAAQLAAASGGPAAVHWVDLAGIPPGDGAGVAGAIAAAFGLTEASGQAPLTRVQQVLRGRAALVVLDNCEHLIDACAQTAHALLQASPALRVLATSQRPLGISGEHRLRVPMLGLPPNGTTDLALIAAAPAVRLLLARVSECGSTLSLDSDALREGAELCRQLDGNALAIELAAVRVASIGLAATRAALAEHFRLLAGGPRDGWPKHRSLEAMIDWSHALLGAQDAAAFRRLAVFAGGWTMEAAIAVLHGGAALAPGGDASNDPADIAGRIAALVERSMIVSEGAASTPRFRMLEAQHFFALGKLRASGEDAALAAAHAGHFAEFFEAGYHQWDDTPDSRWIARHAPERDNLRAAIRFALATSDSALAARLVGASLWLWRASGSTHELRQLLAHPVLRVALSARDGVGARLRLALASSLHWTSSASTSVKAAAAEAVQAYEGSDDVLGAANALLCLASAFAQLGDPLSHEQCLARVETLLGEHRHGKTYAWYCGSHAWASQLAGDLRSALAWVMKSRVAYRGSGAWHGETRALLHLADLELAVGDVGQAIAVGQECIGRLVGGLHREDLGRALANQGAAWFAQGDLERAEDHWLEGLEQLRGRDFSYWVFDHIALLAIARGRDEVAAQMVGYADAGYARFGKGQRVQNEQRAHEHALLHLRSRLASEELDAWLSAGADASEADMMALVSSPAPTRTG